MSSLATNAVTAVLAALTGVPGLPTPQRVYMRPVSADVAQAVVVQPAAAEPGAFDMAGQPISWAISVAVECFARFGAGTAPDVAVDALSQAAYAAVMADPTLGGVAANTEPGPISFNFDADGERTACATVLFTVLQRATPGVF